MAYYKLASEEHVEKTEFDYFRDALKECDVKSNDPNDGALTHLISAHQENKGKWVFVNTTIPNTDNMELIHDVMDYVIDQANKYLDDAQMVEVIFYGVTGAMEKRSYTFRNDNG